MGRNEEVPKEVFAMKIGIVGAGLVGATTAYSLVMRGTVREVVLIDRDERRAAAEAADIGHAVPFAHPAQVLAGGYDALVGAHAVVVSAGVSQRPGESRMELLGRNACVFRDVIPAVLEHAPSAVIVVATNPVDVMTHVAAQIAADVSGRRGCVLGTGTTLDTARFRTLIASHVGVDAQHVHAYVLGEHGDSEVLAWSAATVAGMPLDEFCATRRVEFGEPEHAAIDDAVRRAAERIIEAKGATYYGVGAAIARIVETILGNHRSVLSVSAPHYEVAGVPDVTVSLPCLVGGSGVLDVFEPALDPAELIALGHSARAVRAAIDEVDATACA